MLYFLLVLRFLSSQKNWQRWWQKQPTKFFIYFQHYNSTLWFGPIKQAHLTDLTLQNWTGLWGFVFKMTSSHSPLYSFQSDHSVVSGPLPNLKWSDQTKQTTTINRPSLDFCNHHTESTDQIHKNLKWKWQQSENELLKQHTPLMHCLLFVSLCRAVFHLKAWLGVNSLLVRGLTMQRRDIKWESGQRRGEGTEAKDPGKILCYLFTYLNSNLVCIKYLM